MHLMIDIDENKQQKRNEWLFRLFNYNNYIVM